MLDEAADSVTYFQAYLLFQMLGAENEIVTVSSAE